MILQYQTRLTQQNAMQSHLYSSRAAAAAARLAALRPHRWLKSVASIFFFACLFWGGFHSPLLAQTALVKDINPGTSSSISNTALAVMGSTIYFAANDGPNGFELWKTDGTADGTVMVKNINPSSSSNPAGFTVLGTNLYFAATDGTNGVELWKTDGTADGTVMVKNIARVAMLTDVQLVFHGAGDFAGLIWDRWTWYLGKTDGTANGTVLAGQITNVEQVLFSLLPSPRSRPMAQAGDINGRRCLQRRRQLCRWPLMVTNVQQVFSPSAPLPRSRPMAQWSLGDKPTTAATARP